MAQIEIAKPNTFAIPRAVYDQTGNATGDKIGHALEVLNLFGDIEAVEKNHGRDFAAASRGLGMHIDRRQAGALIRTLHVLHTRPLDVVGRIAQAIHPAHIRIEPVLALRLQKALADVIIGAGALQILRTAGLMPIGDALAAAVLYGARFACPLPEPRIVVTDTCLEPKSDAVDFSNFRAAPRRHVQSNQQPM